jgi:uncharacterized OsmC-like protein
MKLDTEKTLNGLNTQQLIETVGAIEQRPDLAKFQFRARNQWLGGGQNRSTIRDFYGAGQEDSSRIEPFTLVNGEPPALLGSNEGANPTEGLLHALAGCLTTTLVVHATARGIRIDRISTELEGDMDLRGLLDLSRSVPVGYQEIRIKMDVAADCSDEDLDSLIQFAKEHSPVCQTVCRPIPVVVERAAIAVA